MVSEPFEFEKYYRVVKDHLDLVGDGGIRPDTMGEAYDALEYLAERCWRYEDMANS